MNTPNGNILPKNTVQGIATALKNTRKEYNLTQQQVADLAGVSDRTLRTLEQDGTSPSRKALLAVAETLGLTIQVVQR